MFFFIDNYSVWINNINMLILTVIC